MTSGASRGTRPDPSAGASLSAGSCGFHPLSEAFATPDQRSTDFSIKTPAKMY